MRPPKTEDDKIKRRVADRFFLEKTAMIPGAVLKVAKKVSAFLTEKKIPHAIAGGMAVAMHGYARMTRDVDILVPSSALPVIEELGKTSPISGHLGGVSLKVDGVAVDFVFLGKGLRSDDITSPDHFAGLPVVGVEPLVLMKLGAGRMQDSTDIGHLIMLGKVPVKAVMKRLPEADREDFESIVAMAEAEKAGKNKEARRMFLAMARRRSRWPTT